MLRVFAFLVIVGCAALFLLPATQISALIGSVAVAPATHSSNVAVTVTAQDRDDFRPGELTATMTFTPVSGGAPVSFEIEYPKDHLWADDGIGDLWIQTLDPGIPANPEVTPLIANSCLMPIRGEALAQGIDYRTGYKAYIVCRQVAERAEGDTSLWNADTAPTAVVGVLWSARNQQPMDNARNRCIAEARVWAVEIAKPQDRFITCVMVVDEAAGVAETVAFEVTDAGLTVLGVDVEEGYALANPGFVRDADRLVQYRLIQSWLQDRAAFDAAAVRVRSELIGAAGQATPARSTELVEVKALGETGTLFSFVARVPHEVTSRVRKKTLQTYLYGQVKSVICGGQESRAALAFQRNEPVLQYEVLQQNGDPVAMGPLPSAAC